MVVHKKNEEALKEKSAKTKPAETKKEPVVISDVVTKTTETIAVIEEDVVPKESKSETSVESTAEKDPLEEFKEKMIEEESLVPGDAPKKNFIWPILFIFIAAIALLIGIFIYKQGIFRKEKVNVVTLIPAPTTTPEPTKAVDLTQYEIEILNGSGISGEAAKQKTSLEEEGFTVSSIGNASNSDYKDTIIKAKKEVEKVFLDKLKSTLETSFTVAQETLSDDAAVPVIVILGTKK